MKRVYLTVCADYVLAEFGLPFKRPTVKRKLRNYDQFIAFLIECNCEHVLSSSSLDHPEQTTTRPEVLLLCEQLRSREPPKGRWLEDPSHCDNCASNPWYHL